MKLMSFGAERGDGAIEAGLDGVLLGTRKESHRHGEVPQAIEGSQARVWVDDQRGIRRRITCAPVLGPLILLGVE